MGAVVIGFRHEDLGGAAQIAVVRRGGVHERLCGSDAMFLQHHHEHLGVDDRAGVKQFHAGNLTAAGHTRHAELKFGGSAIRCGIFVESKIKQRFKLRQERHRLVVVGSARCANLMASARSAAALRHPKKSRRPREFVIMGSNLTKTVADGGARASARFDVNLLEDNEAA